MLPVWRLSVLPELLDTSATSVQRFQDHDIAYNEFSLFMLTPNRAHFHHSSNSLNLCFQCRNRAFP